MITGAHSVMFTNDAEADRAFFRDVLGLPHVDAGNGWLIFALPPTELGIHPSSGHSGHELFLTCDDLHNFIAQMAAVGVPTAKVTEESWGHLTHVTLPSGSKLGVYQPIHGKP
jgi:catechol 2,3-dioxygenase-like lactoylglutathione lyase family enzyme